MGRIVSSYRQSRQDSRKQRNADSSCHQNQPILQACVRALYEWVGISSFRNQFIVEKKLSIAIDGPAGAGKTTQAKAVAKVLGFTYVDTGAMYRTLALYMKEAGKTMEEVPAALKDVEMRIVREKSGDQKMFLGTRDVTGLIRTPEISKLASDISAIPAVREYLLETQRQRARENNVVMEGRDIGTVILPDATLKVFLTADLDARAWRRGRQMEPGTYLLSRLAEEIKARDENDSKRAEAPLTKAEDAYFLDCSRLTIKETTEAILEMWKAATAEKSA